MASLGDVFMRVVADTTGFKAEVSKVAGEAGAAGSANLAQNLTTGLLSAGKSLTQTGKSLTTSLTLPIVAAGAVATKFALDFDTSMRQIVGLAKVPKEAIGGIREEILGLSRDTGRAPNELAQAFYFVASAGFKADEAFKVLQISAKAAAAGMGQTSDIAKVLGGVINAYGHENLSAARAGDILTAAIQDGSAEAADFAGAIGQVVPNASALGVSFDQVAAAMASMTNVGVDAETAATNLSQIFTSLLKPTSQANAALQGVGLSAAGLREELRNQGLLATLRTLQTAFEGNDTAIAAVFGNVRALRGVNALLSQDEAQLNAVFNDTSTALGNLQDAYAATDGPQRAFDRAIANLQTAAIRLGAIILPGVAQALSGFADAVANVVAAFTSLPKPIQTLSLQFLTLVAAIGPVLLIGGKVLTMFGALGKAILFLTGTGAGSLGALIAKIPLVGVALSKVLGPASLVLLALQALSAVQDEMGKSTDVGKRISEWSDVAKAAGVSVASLNDEVRKLAKETGVSTSQIADAFRSELGAGSTLDEAIAHIRDQIAHGFEPEGAGLRNIAHGYGVVFVQELPKAGPAITAAAKTMLSGIPGAMQLAQDEAADIARHTPYEIAKSFDEGRDAVYQAALGLGESQTRAQITDQPDHPEAGRAHLEGSRQAAEGQEPSGPRRGPGARQPAQARDLRPAGRARPQGGPRLQDPGRRPQEMPTPRPDAGRRRCPRRCRPRSPRRCRRRRQLPMRWARRCPMPSSTASGLPTSRPRRRSPPCAPRSSGAGPTPRAPACRLARASPRASRIRRTGPTPATPASRSPPTCTTASRATPGMHGVCPPARRGSWASSTR